MKIFALETVTRYFRNHQSQSSFFVYQHRIDEKSELDVFDFQLCFNGHIIFEQTVHRNGSSYQSTNHCDPCIIVDKTCFLWFQIPYDLLNEKRIYDILLNKSVVHRFEHHHVIQMNNRYLESRLHLKIDKFYQDLFESWNEDFSYLEIPLEKIYFEDNMTEKLNEFKKWILNQKYNQSWHRHYSQRSHKLKQYYADDKDIFEKFMLEIKQDRLDFINWIFSPISFDNIPTQFFSYIAIQHSHENDVFDFEDKYVFKGNKSIDFSHYYQWNSNIIKPYLEDNKIETIKPFYYLILSNMESIEDINNLKIKKSIHQNMNYKIKKNEVTYQQDGFFSLNSTFNHQNNYLCENCTSKVICRNIIPSGLGKIVFKNNVEKENYQDCSIFIKIENEAIYQKKKT